jgi:hypothetical protein
MEPPKQRRAPLVEIAIVAVGLAMGVVLFALMAAAKVDALILHNPAGWQTARGIGELDADPLVRASVTRIGIFANAKEEAIYLQGTTDGPPTFGSALRGEFIRKLRGEKRYRVVGRGELPVEFWTFTVYGDDDFLVDHPSRVYSVGSFDVARTAEGGFVVELSPTRPEGAVNWIPTPSEGRFSLTFRLYRPAPELALNLETYALPRLEEVP